jgi:hypothetical protein
MPLHWVSYRRDNLLAGATIIESPSLRHAQTLAAFQWGDPHLQFAEAHTLGTRHASLVPERAIGRMLSLTEVHRLSIRFERGEHSEQGSSRMKLRAAVQSDKAFAIQRRRAQR